MNKNTTLLLIKKKEKRLELLESFKTSELDWFFSSKRLLDQKLLCNGNMLSIKRSTTA